MRTVTLYTANKHLVQQTDWSGCINRRIPIGHARCVHRRDEVLAMEPDTLVETEQCQIHRLAYMDNSGYVHESFVALDKTLEDLVGAKARQVVSIERAAEKEAIRQWLSYAGFWTRIKWVFTGVEL